MAAKQKHIQRVKQRILEKLRSLDEQEQAHFDVLHEHISNVKQRAKDLLQLEDCGQFLSQYNRVIQSLDACYNNLELLTADAEDRLNSDTADDIFVDTFGLETKSVMDDSALHSPSSVLGYDSHLFKDRTLTQDDVRPSTSSPILEETVRPFALTPSEQSTADKVKAKLSTAVKESVLDCTGEVRTQLRVETNEGGLHGSIAKDCTSDKNEKVIQKHPCVPIEVKKQLRQQFQSALDSDSSVSSSQVLSVDNLSACEEKAPTSSSPKKKSRRSKKKGRSKSVPKTELARLAKTEEKNIGDENSPSLKTVETKVDRTNKAEKEIHNKNSEASLNQSEKVKQTEKCIEKENVDLPRKEDDSEACWNQSEKVKQAENYADRETHAAKSNKNVLGQNLEKIIEKDINVKNNTEKLTEAVSENNEKQGDISTIVYSRCDKTLNQKISISEPSTIEMKECASTEDHPKILQGTLLEKEATPVIVSEIINPWCFYVQRYGTALNELMEEICRYMSAVGLTEKPLENPEEGTLCLALYSKDSLYYRGVITKTYTEVSEVDVIYVDYGNRERVKANKLRALPPHLTMLPAQAICCALAEVMPCNKYNEWTEEDIFNFMQYVQRQQLECTPVGRSSGKDMPYLVRLFIHAPMPAVPQASLYLTKISIASLLVDSRLAKEVGIAEQVSMIMKFMADMGDFVFTLGSSDSSGIEIKELSESHICEDASGSKNSEVEECVSLDLKSEASVRAEKETSHTETIDQTLVSPRSECSDTESQKDSNLVVKGTERHDSHQNVKELNGNLPEIKEEAELDIVNTDKNEPAVSTCGSLEMIDSVSNITDQDTSDARSVDTGFHSSDFNFNLDLNSQGHEVMLSYVKSPSLFYAHVISREVGYNLDRLMKCLNQKFEKLSKKELTRLSKSFKPALNKLCCARFMIDKSFYRAAVKELPSEADTSDKKTEGKVRVFYVDFGDDDWVPRSWIFPLPESFLSLPPLVLKCSLAYIKPISSEKNGSGLTWPEDATKAFVALATFEKRLLMHVVHGSLSADRKGELIGDDKSTVGVLLIDNSDGEEICINMDLIRLGLAELDPTHAQVEKQEVSAPMTGWNPMEDDYFSIRNSYNIDVDDVGVATTGYKAQDEKRICKFYNRGSCWRGERCPWKHVRSVSGVTMDKEEVYAMDNNQESLLPEVHCWVAMEISTILTPGHFYAILPMGNKSLDCAETKKDNAAVYGELKETETLDDLQASLNEEYSHKSMHEGTLILRAPGEIVAARFPQDQLWYRARVLQSTEEKVRVFYLDFGNTEWLSMRDVHEIQPQFLHLPFQAIECFLNVEPVEDGETWSKDAKSAFRELVDGKTLVGHIKSKSWNGCIWLELYDTTGEDDINIVDAMVEKGFAIRTASFTDTSSEAETSFKSEAKSEILMVPG